MDLSFRISPRSFLLFGFCLAAAFLPFSEGRTANSNEVVSGVGSSSSGSDITVRDYFTSVLKCFKNPSVKKEERITPTAEAFGKAFDLAKQAGKIKKMPSKAELRHLIAQIMIETGWLDALTQKGKNAESFPGRGFIQITGEDNYKTCGKFISGIPGYSADIPAQISGGGATADNLIGDRAFDGNGGSKTGSDRLVAAALCSLAWWENAKKNDDFEKAIEESSVESARIVSTKVNAGPAANVGDKVNNMEERLKAFQEVNESCHK